MGFLSQHVRIYQSCSFVFLARSDLSRDHPNGSLHTIMCVTQVYMLYSTLEIAGLTKFGYLWINVPHSLSTHPFYVGSKWPLPTCTSKMEMVPSGVTGSPGAHAEG